MYPRVVIDLEKLRFNIVKIAEMAKANNINNLTYVVKAFAGDKRILKLFSELNITSVGDSRIQNLKLMKDYQYSKMLLRIPMISEASDVIDYADISLNSEIDVLKELNKLAKQKDKMHDVIIMFDLGDLREGIYFKSNYLDKIQEIISLSNINILGIGTNLTCYGGLVPTKKILKRLVEIKTNIENNFKLDLKIVSGGNSSTVNLFGKALIPSEINHLRIGEAYILGMDTAYSTEIEGLYHDAFHLEAEIIELQEKPSYPDGDISINSFGKVPDIIDKGYMHRAILAIGKQDVILENLIPFNSNISILGGSSDHLIVEIKNGDYKVGDVIKFKLNYPALLHLMNSNYITKYYK